MLRRPLLTGSAMLLAAAALAADRNPPPPSQQPQVGARAPEATAPAAADFPLDGQAAPADPALATGQSAVLATELSLAREQESVQVAALTAALETARTAAERRDLQLRISQIKNAGQRQALVIQLEHARRAGPETLAQKLETELAGFDALRAAPRAPLLTAAERAARPVGGAAR
jgi:hypothetical protein